MLFFPPHLSPILLVVGDVGTFGSAAAEAGSAAETGGSASTTAPAADASAANGGSRGYIYVFLWR